MERRRLARFDLPDGTTFSVNVAVVANETTVLKFDGLTNKTTIQDLQKMLEARVADMFFDDKRRMETEGKVIAGKYVLIGKGCGWYESSYSLVKDCIERDGDTFLVVPHSS